MIDVLIITAMPLEYDEARLAGSAAPGGVGVQHWEEHDADTNAPYLLGEYRGSDDVNLSVALARSVRTGGLATAPLAQKLAAHLQPRCLAMSGVCAGAPTRTTLGDVVVADMAYAYDEGKRTIDGFYGDQRNHPQYDEVIRAAQELRAATLPSYGEATDEEAKLWFLAMLLFGQDPGHHPAVERYFPSRDLSEPLAALEDDGLITWQDDVPRLTDPGRSHIKRTMYMDRKGPERLPFDIVVGPIATGRPVTEDPAIWGELESMGVRTITGLEMEAADLVIVAKQEQIPFWIVAKGVMDHANPNRDDRYKKFAARASANVLYTLLSELANKITAVRSNDGGPRVPDWRTRLRRQGLNIWTTELFAAGMAGSVDAYQPLQQNEVVDARLLQAGRLPNLQLQFEGLSRKFDEWIDSCRQRQGQGGLQVFWVVGEPSPERSMALLAVVSRAWSAGRAVYDPGRDLDLASEIIAELGHAELPVEPALVPVDLPAHESRVGWTKLFKVRDSVRRYESAQRDPVLVVGGTPAQMQAAHGILQSSIEIEPFDHKGLPYPQLRTDHGLEGLESVSLSSEHIFNQGLPTTTPRLFGRAKEMTKLQDAWLSEKTRVLSVVAAGGVGKSSLVNAWLRDMRDRDYLGAERVFAWSFYSQGTRENQVSADTFVKFALKWLGDKTPPSPSPAVEGARLAKLIREHHFLLILDGLEPLQHPATAPDVGGKIKDASITALLRELARPGWNGLCLITTRVPLTDDLTPRERHVPVTDSLKLDNLDEPAGAGLLQSLIGRQKDVEAVNQAVRYVHGHALSVNLLGRYLRDVHARQLSGLSELQNLSTAVANSGHAQRIMEKYAEWLEGDERVGELAILNIIGLFDRPAPYAAIAAILADTELGSSAPGLDEIGSAEWIQYVSKLREMGLLGSDTAGLPDTLDAHPLVREHFRDRLRTTANDLWNAGNRALYNYFKRRAPQLPDNAEDMSLLYAAVNHGCAIDLHQEVFDTVIEPRVWRGPRESYSTRILGMTGSEVVALSNYFQMPSWTRFRKNASLSKQDQLLVMSSAALRLRQLGRLDDARASCSAVPSADESVNMADAAYVESLHCELQVVAGQLGPARESAESAIGFADRSDDAYFKMYTRTCLAEVDFMEGDFYEAQEWFAEAKAIASEQRSNLPFLYSQNLYRYGYFVIETGGASTLLANAEQNPEWGLNGKNSSQLSRAIQKLILGAAHRSQVEQAALGSEHLGTASALVDDALVMFRGAGYTDYLVRGLLERAHLLRIRRHPDDYTSALDDLDEAQEEATRGSMKLLAADVSLQRAACHLAFWQSLTSQQQADLATQVTGALAEATKRYRDLHYQRRKPMLAELKQQAESYGFVWLGAHRRMSTTPRVAGSGDT